MASAINSDEYSPPRRYRYETLIILAFKIKDAFIQNWNRKQQLWFHGYFDRLSSLFMVVLYFCTVIFWFGATIFYRNRLTFNARSAKIISNSNNSIIFSQPLGTRSDRYCSNWMITMAEFHNDHIADILFKMESTFISIYKTKNICNLMFS